MPGVDVFSRENLEEAILSGASYVFHSAVEFQEYIETSASHNGMTVTSMLLDFCEAYDVEYESLAEMLTQNLKDKIAVEMQEMGLMPQTAQLEFE